MPLYVTRWTDGTISFFAAPAEDQIFSILDRESIPDAAEEIYRIDCTEPTELHIGTNLHTKDSHPVVGVYSVGKHTKLTKINLPFK